MIKLILRLIYILITFIEGLIITRIILLIINANTENAFVNWILNISSIFISPFDGVVTSRVAINNFELPINALVALLFYIIAGFIVSELLSSFSKN
jgi:phage shock protein PspC (stress-responsive transcriptional regulator)